MAVDILIVDDEQDIRELISGILEDEGYRTRLAGDSESALSEIEARRPSLIVLDIWLMGSKLDGLDLLDEIKKNHPDVPVVIISGHGNIETAVSAIKRGAYEYIEKPFKADRLLLVISRALENSRLKRENKDLKERGSVHALDIVGGSASIKSLKLSIERSAKSNSRVFITGPSGSGKELAARCLHEWSHRTMGNFCTLHAALVTPENFETELFGVEEGEGRNLSIGILEEAHNGTLYIDEICDMPLETQAKILNVLVDQKFKRVGGAQPVSVDVRIICSSSKNITEEIAEGRLREDLFHRLNVVPLVVPPLSERQEDIPKLVDYFMEKYSRQSGQPASELSSEAMVVLQTHSWNGNVRELKNNVERLMILHSESGDEAIGPSQVRSSLESSSDFAEQAPTVNLVGMPLREAREAFEKDYLQTQIKRFGGNISRTASFVGMERSALHRKMKQLGMTETKEEA